MYFSFGYDFRTLCPRNEILNSLDYSFHVDLKTYSSHNFEFVFQIIFGQNIIFIFMLN